jgi:hypothetical protein
VTAPDVATDEIDIHCWCCGQTFAEAQLVRLGSDPEAGVCFRCARFLNRKARERQDVQHPSPGARARAVVSRGRDVVIEHGWHRLPVIGATLRWVDDRLP